MKIKILHLDRLDKKAHYRLQLESLEFSPYNNIPNVEKAIKRQLDKIAINPKNNAMVVARDEYSGELLGQLWVGLGFGDIGLIQPWQPIIHPNANRDKVAISLIEFSKEIVKSHKKTKMEVWMELSNDHVKSLYPVYKDWYEKAGFHLSSDEYNMEASLSDLENFTYSIPLGIEVVLMKDVPIEDLREAVFEVFKNSKDQWVNNLSDEEIRSVVRSWMKVEESFHSESSIVFLENEKIIGFNGMEIQEDSVEVGPLGVIPSHRGKKLGRLLLLESIKRFQSEQEKKVILSVSTKNTPAFNVYSGLGFQTQFRTLIYTWTPN